MQAPARSRFSGSTFRRNARYYISLVFWFVGHYLLIVAEGGAIRPEGLPVV